VPDEELYSRKALRKRPKFTASARFAGERGSKAARHHSAEAKEDNPRAPGEKGNQTDGQSTDNERKNLKGKNGSNFPGRISLSSTTKTGQRPVENKTLRGGYVKKDPPRFENCALPSTKHGERGGCFITVSGAQTGKGGDIRGGKGVFKWAAAGGRRLNSQTWLRKTREKNGVSKKGN